MQTKSKKRKPFLLFFLTKDMNSYHLIASSLFASDCSSLIQGKRVAEVADYLEQKCHCGISALYLQGETDSFAMNCYNCLIPELRRKCLLIQRISVKQITDISGSGEELNSRQSTQTPRSQLPWSYSEVTVFIGCCWNLRCILRMKAAPL